MSDDETIKMQVGNVQFGTAGGTFPPPFPPKPPKRVAVEIGCDVNGRVCAARGNDGSMWQLGDRWTRLPDLPQE